MARVRYLGPEPVTVPELGRAVEPDEVVEVPDARYDGYICQPATWETVEEPADYAAPEPEQVPLETKQAPADAPASPPAKRTAAKSVPQQREG
ncbi:hypothetical protein ACIBQ5_05325 [Streptomyces massasporeus]|uniref:hypothetical protein n=1 Tax=Streptomyces massasporeus TaxID=67324 RepID=UPI0037A8883A